MIRATEIVIIAKVQNQASAQLRRIAKDLGGLGAASNAANRMQAMQQRIGKQRLRMDTLGANQRELQLRHTERMLQLERDLSTNMTSRIRLAQRLANTADANKRLILERQIEGTYDRQSVLTARRRLYEEQSANAAARHTAQLKMQEAEMARLVQEQKLMTALQRTQTAQTVARGISHVGRGATFGGLLSTAGFAMASKQYADFGTLVTKASTQIADNANKGVNAVLGSSKRLEAAIMRQMQIFPASQTEMADALYQLYSSMDLTEKQGIKMLATTNKVAVAFGSDMPTATNVLITTLNNFGVAAGGVNGTLDDLAAIVRIGRMELEDFDSMMNSVAPAAQGAGYNLKQMGGAMALITRLIPSQERAATGLARLIDIFGNKDFQTGMAKAGKPIVDNTGKLIEFEKVIERIASLKPTNKGLQNFIQIMTATGRGRGQGITGQANARRALVQLVKHYQELHRAQMDVNDSTGEFNQRFKAMIQSPGVQWQIFINQLRVLALEIGHAAIPAIVKLQGWIKGLIARWHELSPGVRNAIVYFTALTGVFMLVGGPILTVIGSISSLITMFIILNKTLGVAGGTGTIGRLGMVWLMLGRLAAIGTITITIAYVAKKVGAWKKLEDLSLGITDALGLTHGRPGEEKPFFNPEARIPGANTKATKQMLKDIASARDPVSELQKKLDDSAASIIKNVKNGMLMKDLMAQWDDQISGASKSLKQYNDDLAQWSKQRADVIRSAHEEYQNIIDTAVNNMISKYNELKQANESAFGTLFQGPLLTGESFQEAQQWGISPTIGIINKDLSQQINAFNKWKGDLNALAKRGAPKQLVQELTQLGPEAADRVEALRKASPKMFNRFIALWKQKQRAITRATKADFNQQLKEWESHGKNMGLKIIAGLETEGGALERTMRNILRNSFNGDLLSEIVDKALAEFMRDHPAPKKPPAQQKLPTATASGGTTTHRVTPISKMNLQQVNRALKRDVPRLRGLNNALIHLADWVDDPNSEGGRNITSHEKAQLATLSRQRARLARRVKRERRRRRTLIRQRRATASKQSQFENTSNYQPMPRSPQYIQVNLQSNEPTVVAARKAAWMVAQRAKSV